MPIGVRPQITLETCAESQCSQMFPVLTFQGMFGAWDSYIADQLTLAYADGGQTVRFRAYTSDGSMSATAVSVTIVGYLIDLP
jgi:hypothetical protein